MLSLELTRIITENKLIEKEFEKRNGIYQPKQKPTTEEEKATHEGIEFQKQGRLYLPLEEKVEAETATFSDSYSATNFLASNKFITVTR